MPSIDELRALPIFQNSMLEWLVALLVAAGSFVLLLAARRVVHRYHKRFQEQNRAPVLRIPLRILGRTSLPFFVALALFFALSTLQLGERGQSLLSSVITIALFWQVGIWLAATAAAWIEHKRITSVTADRAALGSLGIIGFIVNAVIWSFVFLLTLENLGIDITALVAGLGIGGIAVALAVQNIFSDLFASLSITLDRPFVIGDFLQVGDVLGSVETIGIKSTRIRSLSGEQVVMPNADLLSSRVRNYGRMAQRRVAFTTSVAYGTPLRQIERIPALIREIVESQPDTRFDRSHFAKHGPVALDFETVYYVLSADYNRYMDIQQAINLRLHRELEEREVSFAYPAQRLLLGAFEAARQPATGT